MSRRLRNIDPTDYDLLTFSEVSYRQGRTRHDVFFSRGFQVFREVQDVETGLRLFMFLPAWFPPRRLRDAFDYTCLPEALTVGFCFRGTDSDLAGNVKADLELLWSKLTDSGLPDIANQAIRKVLELLEELHSTYPVLEERRVQLNVVASGHSLGGFLAEVATVLLHEFCEKECINWRCVSFDSPGLPQPYLETALSAHDSAFWEERITTYVAAPNPINMLHSHLGKLVHVRIPFAQTISYMAKCVAVDAARLYVIKAAAGGVVSAAQSLASSEVSLATQLRAAAVDLVSSAWAGAATGSGCEAMLSVGSILGVEITELMEQHRLPNFYPCFDHDTGTLLPEYRVDMLSWPCCGNLKQSLLQLVQSTLLSLLPSFMCSSNMGVLNIMDRNGMIQSRIASLPGYVPAPTSLSLCGQAQDPGTSGQACNPESSFTACGVSAADTKFAAWRTSVLGKRRKTDSSFPSLQSLGSLRQLSFGRRGAAP